MIAGDVRVGERRARKPGELVDAQASLAVTRPPPYVSRGGIKLANALDALAIDPRGRRCLDVGGDRRFQRLPAAAGAAEVIALDVAYGELHWRIRQDPRVTVLERHNARALRAADLPYAPDLIVVDVSFISLMKVLPAAIATAADRFDCLALVKPQFEVGREKVGARGVVRAADARRAALVAVGEQARRQLGASVLGFAPQGCLDLPATARASPGSRSRAPGCPDGPRGRGARWPSLERRAALDHGLQPRTHGGHRRAASQGVRAGARGWR